MNHAQRYLVVAPQGLGDSLEATPLVRALRVAYPDARIEVAVLRSGPRALFGGLPAFVDEVLYLPFWERGATTFVAAVARARRGRRYDASFLAYPSANWKYLALLAVFSSRRRYAHAHGGDAASLRWARVTPVPVRRVANVERNLDLLRAAGIAPGSADGYLVPSAWQGTGERFGVTLHVGSVTHDGLAAKRWPLERFSDLARRLVADGEDVSVVFGPDERVESLRLCEEIPGVRAVQGSLDDVARYLAARRLVVANDNGIAHLAAGVGTPTIAIFGPTPVEFAPFARNAVALRPSDCPPCFDVRRPVVECVLNIDFACLRAVTVEMVHASARRVLDASESPA